MPISRGTRVLLYGWVIRLLSKTIQSSLGKQTKQNKAIQNKNRIPEMSVVKETHGKPKTYGKLPKDIKERCILKYSKHSVTTE